MPLAAYRILLVDDDGAMRAHVRDLLADGLPGATFAEAATAEETLSLVANERWDAVTLDIHLPCRSGLDILPELRACSPDLVIIALSGLPASPYAATAVAAGASAFVAKDRAPEELVATLGLLLGARR